MKGKSKTFYRYILSYALVLILPVALLFLFSYSFLLNRFSLEITQRNALLLSQVQDSFDTQLEQLINISYVIQNTSLLNTRTIDGDIVAARSAVQTLSMYNSITTLPETIITYRSGTNACYTSTAMITPEKLFSQQLVYDNHTVEDFFETVDRPESIVTWPADSVRQFGGKETEYITLFISVSGGSLTPKQRSVYLIPAARIHQMLMGVTQEYAGSVLITDSDGALLLGIGPITQEAFQQALARYGKQERLNIDGNCYFISTARSNTVGWNYAVIIPASAIEAPMRRTQQVMVLLLLAVTICGGVAVYFFSNRHYKPLRQLRDKALSYAPRTDAASEMRQVEAVLDALSQESQTYRKTLEESRETLLQSSLNHLLMGENALESLRELAQHGLALPEDRQYRVAVLEYGKAGDNGLQENIAAFIASVSFGWPDAVLCSAPPVAGDLALIFPGAFPEDGVEDSLFSLKNHLSAHWEQNVSIGISLPCSLPMLHEAYDQAVRALQFKLVRGSGCMVTYSSDLETASSLQNYPREQLEALQWYLLQLDIENVRIKLHEILGGMLKEKVSFNMARMVCFDVVNVTIRTLYSMQSNKNSLVIAPEMLEQLISFDTVPELIALLENFVDETCASVSSLQTSPKDERAKGMQEYIQNNCFNEAFSLQVMADYFGLTPSNLSHYFKNCTGQGVLEQVQSLRKAEACRLLSQTDDPVQIVGQKIGMSNVSSFIRSFKQQTGMTPGQYRKYAASQLPYEERG